MDYRNAIFSFRKEKTGAIFRPCFSNMSVQPPLASIVTSLPVEYSSVARFEPMSHAPYIKILIFHSIYCCVLFCPVYKIWALFAQTPPDTWRQVLRASCRRSLSLPSVADSSDTISGLRIANTILPCRLRIVWRYPFRGPSLASHNCLPTRRCFRSFGCLKSSWIVKALRITASSFPDFLQIAPVERQSLMYKKKIWSFSSSGNLVLRSACRPISGTHRTRFQHQWSTYLLEYSE